MILSPRLRDCQAEKPFVHVVICAPDPSSLIRAWTRRWFPGNVLDRAHLLHPATMAREDVRPAGTGNARADSSGDGQDGGRRDGQALSLQPLARAAAGTGAGVSKPAALSADPLAG